MLALIPLNLDGFLFSADYQSGQPAEITSRVAANCIGWEKDPALFVRGLEKGVRALPLWWAVLGGLRVAGPRSGARRCEAQRSPGAKNRIGIMRFQDGSVFGSAHQGGAAQCWLTARQTAKKLKCACAPPWEQLALAIPRERRSIGAETLSAMNAKFIKLLNLRPFAASLLGTGSRQDSQPNRRRAAKWRAAACLLMLLAGLGRSQAATEVCGIVTNDHWTKAGAPYLATCDIVVLGTLTIDPGVWVLFQSNNVFQVNGLLTAVGTAADPICFTRTNGPGGWQGIYFNYGSPGSQLTYCAISNSVNSGIRIENGGPTNMQNCIIANNSTSSTYGGGGIWWSFWGGRLILENCEIVANSAATTSAASGLQAPFGKVELYNCEFIGNVGALAAGGPLQSYGHLNAANCTFSRNTGDGLSGFFSITNCTFAYNAGLALAAYGPVIDCILYFNNSGGTQVPTNYASALPLSYCDVQNGYPGTGNFDFDPKFQSATDLHLAPGSPCIDTGNPDPAFNDTCFPPSLGGVRNDMGAYGGPGACGWVAGAAPVLVAQPQPQSGCLGQSAAFQVSAAGSPPLTYQWWFNGTPLAGQTGTNLVLTNLASTQAGAYSVVVSNTAGSVTSAPVQLVVNDACVDLRLYAGLNIAGQTGASYVLSYTTNLSAPVTWLPLATNTMPSAGWFYLDMDSPFSPQRFYQVKLQP